MLRTENWQNGNQKIVFHSDMHCQEDVSNEQIWIKSQT